MFVELHINGELKRNWHFENGNFKEPFCEAGFQEKQRMWNEIKVNCKLSALEASINLYDVEHYEFFVRIRARVQPDDITDEEYQEFLQQVIDARAVIDKLKKRYRNESVSKDSSEHPTDQS